MAERRGRALTEFQREWILLAELGGSFSGDAVTELTGRLDLIEAETENAKALASLKFYGDAADQACRDAGVPLRPRSPFRAWPDAAQPWALEAASVCGWAVGCLSRDEHREAVDVLTSITDIRVSRRVLCMLMFGVYAALNALDAVDPEPS